MWLFWAQKNVFICLCSAVSMAQGQGGCSRQLMQCDIAEFHWPSSLQTPQVGHRLPLYYLGKTLGWLVSFSVKWGRSLGWAGHGHAACFLCPQMCISSQRDYEEEPSSLYLPIFSPGMIIQTRKTPAPFVYSPYFSTSFYHVICVCKHPAVTWLAFCFIHEDLKIILK